MAALGLGLLAGGTRTLAAAPSATAATAPAPAALAGGGPRFLRDAACACFRGLRLGCETGCGCGGGCGAYIRGWGLGLGCFFRCELLLGGGVDGVCFVLVLVLVFVLDIELVLVLGLVLECFLGRELDDFGCGSLGRRGRLRFW